MAAKDLRKFGETIGVTLMDNKKVIEYATEETIHRHKYSPDQIKKKFDSLIKETEFCAYNKYLECETDYCKKIFTGYVRFIVQNRRILKPEDVGKELGKDYKLFDKFFLSLAQSRKSRAGKTFETIHNSLFKKLGYPFDEQVIINGKPDFIMPSKEHWERNPMECIIFTAKRTLRERWRQIVTEGTLGYGFYLATIDEGVSKNGLKEMLRHRIYLVVPNEIKQQSSLYSGAVNVLNFQEFFEDHLDPKVRVWKKKGII